MKVFIYDLERLMPSPSPNHRVLAWLLVHIACLALAACGGGGDSAATPAPPPVATTPPATTPAAPAEPTPSEPAPSDPTTPLVAVVAGTPHLEGLGHYADGVGTAADFGSIAGLSVDKVGNIFVSDGVNCVLRKIATDGTVSRFAGQLGRCAQTDVIPTPVDGDAGNARFAQPSMTVIDAHDNLFMVDMAAIRKITPQGRVTTVAGQVKGTEPIVDGTGSAARFLKITSLAIRPDGTMLVADATHDFTPTSHQIPCEDVKYNFLREVTPVGQVKTLQDSWFNCVVPNDSLLSNASALRYDKAGTLYFIRSNRFTSDGFVKRPAGGQPAFINDETGARIVDAPYRQELAIDDDGNIFYLVADGIVKIAQNGKRTKVLSPQPDGSLPGAPGISFAGLKHLTYAGGHDFLAASTSVVIRLTMR